MGKKKWVALAIVLLFPAMVSGGFKADIRNTSGLLYSPSKIAFPVGANILYSLPEYRFDVVDGTLCIYDVNSRKNIFIDASTGKQTTQPESMPGKTPRRIFYTKRNSMEVLGDPVRMIAKDRGGYIIDENRYVLYELVPAYTEHFEDKQFKVKYFENGVEMANFSVCGYPGMAEVFGKHLFVSSYSTINAFNLETMRQASFWYSPANSFVLGKNRFNGSLMFFGAAVFDLDQYKSYGNFGEYPVFYKDYVLSTRFSYKEPKTGRYVSDVWVQTLDKKTINQKVIEIPSAKFAGSIGDYAYGTSSGQENNVFIIKVPTWKVTYSLKFEDYARIISDDGRYVLIWKGENIIAINPEDGSQAWKFNLGFEPNHQIESIQALGNRVYVIETYPIGINKNCRILKVIENGKVSEIFRWECASPRKYNNDTYTEVSVYEDGFIKVPNYETGLPIQIYDANGKLVREIAIPGLMSEKICSYLYFGGYIFVNCNGYDFYKINLKTGKYETVKIAEKVVGKQVNDAYQLLVDKKYAVAHCQTGQMCILDWQSMSINRKVKGIYPWVINGNLLAGREIYVIDRDEIIKLPERGTLGPVWSDKQIITTIPDFGEQIMYLVISQDGQVFDAKFNSPTFLLYDRGYVFGNDFVSNWSVFDFEQDRVLQDYMNSPANIFYAPFGQGYVATDFRSVYEMKPCPTYSIKRISSDEFVITNTRTDGQAGSIKGVLSVALWGLTPRFEGVTITKNHQEFGPLCPGQSQTVKIDIESVASDPKYLGRIGVIVESNGFIDAKNTNPDDSFMFPYDGYYGIDPEKILSVTVWNELP